MSPITRDAWSAQVTWEVETSGSWEDYVAQVRERLFGFERTSAGADAARFRRSAAGDVHTLRFERLSHEPLRVRVTFLVLVN